MSSVIPVRVGFEPNQIIEEYNACIDARIEQRMRHLEAIAVMMGEWDLKNPLDDRGKNKEHVAGPRSLEQLVHPLTMHVKLRALI